MSEIRVTYSGLIGLVVSLLSIVTGFIFSLIITRRLAPEEYGAWALIGSMIFYFIISESMISFWTVRQISRGEEVGKTSIISSLMIAAGAIPLYIAYVVLVSSQNDVDTTIMIFGAFIIPVYFISQTLEAINQGHKPHIRSLGRLVFESMKIPGVLFLVMLLDLGVNGVIISVTLAYLGKIALQSYFAKSKIRVVFNLDFLKRWIRLSKIV